MENIDKVTRTTARPAMRLAALSLLVAASLVAVSLVATVFLAGMTSAARAATAAGASVRGTTARIQALLDRPVNGKVDLPSGTFTIRPALRLHQTETIIGHHTTLKVASGSDNYAAVLSGASAATDLTGLTITGVTFDQNTAGNPIHSVSPLYHGFPRFVVLVVAGSNVKITHNTFKNTNNVNTIVTGGATSHVTIGGNIFHTANVPLHDHSSIYTSGTHTVISKNSLIGAAMCAAAAIEVHGDGVWVTGNQVRGYYKAANIVSSDTTFSGNVVRAAANPVDLWSTVSPGLHDVKVTDNVLNRDLPYWARLLHQLGGSLPPAKYTKRVITDTTSKFPMHRITIRGNRG